MPLNTAVKRGTCDKRRSQRIGWSDTVLWREGRTEYAKIDGRCTSHCK